MKIFSGSVENEDCNCKEYIKANERTLISCFSSTTFEKVGEGLSFSLFIFLYTKKVATSTHMMQKCRTRTDENKIDHIARLAGKIFWKD